MNHKLVAKVLGALLAVPVEAGEHTFEMRYIPDRKSVV